MNFGQRLVALMLEKNIDRQTLADYLGLSYSSIAKYEKSVNTPGLEILNKLADYFETSIDYLAGRTTIRDPLYYEAVKDDPEMKEFWEDIVQNRELKLMFKKTKELSPEDIREVIHYIKWMEERERQKRGW